MQTQIDSEEVIAQLLDQGTVPEVAVGCFIVMDGLHNGCGEVLRGRWNVTGGGCLDQLYALFPGRVVVDGCARVGTHEVRIHEL